MIYFDEMVEKYGFDDGEMVVDAFFDYREVYLRVVNALAARNGSTCRMVAWNRPGMHNCCMIVTVSVTCFDALSAESVLSPESRYWDLSEWPESEAVVENDDAMNQAIEAAREMSLDDLVVVKSKIAKKALNKILRGIQKK